MSRKISSIVFGNLASKLVGLLREVLFAAWFGTGQTAAGFRIAQTAYLMPAQALIGDSLSAGLLPLYRKIKAEDEYHAKVLVLVAAVYGLVFSVVVSSLLYSFSHEIVGFMAPGVAPGAQSLAAKLLKIMGLSTPFFILGGMLSYIEAAFGRFGAIAWRPMLLNIGSISGAAAAVYTHQDHWLATLVFASHFVFFLWTLVQLRRLGGVWPRGRIPLSLMAHMSGRFLVSIVPLLGLPLAAQINTLVERMVSSHLGTAIIPSVDYARFVSDTTVQLIAMPLGVLTMSLHGGSKSDDAKRHVTDMASTIMILAFPIAGFIALNAEPIVRVVFARGAFGEESVQTTQAVLQWMGGALGMTVTGYYLIKALNAQIRNLESFAITAIACAASILVNLTLWRSLGPPTVGLAVASYSAVVFTLCLIRLSLWRDLIPLGLWICAGLAVQALAGFALPVMGGMGAYGNLAGNALLSGALWCGLAYWVGPVRRAASPVLLRIPLLRTLFRESG